MTELNSDQRKALRRLARGKSIKRSMFYDPVIEKCISTDHYLSPPNLDNMPFPQSMIEWCDWEAQAHSTNWPRINEYGEQLLRELEESKD